MTRVSISNGFVVAVYSVGPNLIRFEVQDRAVILTADMARQLVGALDGAIDVAEAKERKAKNDEHLLYAQSLMRRSFEALKNSEVPRV